MPTYLPYGLRSIVCVWTLLISFPLRSQQVPEMTAPGVYRVVFTDKDMSPFSTARPEEFLSVRSIARRSKQGIAIEESDLPVSPAYIDSIAATGVSILTLSKWFNALTFKTSDMVALEKIMHFPFVAGTVPSKKKGLAVPFLASAVNKIIMNESRALDYGKALRQTDMLHGPVLHDKGYTGQGMHIAVIDNGFYDADVLAAFADLWGKGQILGTRDFVDPSSDIFSEGSHGMKVLSIMGGYLPGMLTGTAPAASYWLLRSENAGSEYMVEEDNWIAAAEFADSAGVDIINTSLGYSRFDDPLQDHAYADMNGHTARISLAAGLAASKGMLVVVSAGNQGETDWKYITAPADADQVLAVGAVDGEGRLASFSSRGPSSDNRIKPDVVALGKGTYYAGTDGSIWQGNGTSLSAPVIAGLSACLWQANPDASAMEIREAVIQSASLYGSPDSLCGYGIPDFSMADILLGGLEGIWEEADRITVFPNPFRDELYVLFETPVSSDVLLELIDPLGRVAGRALYSGFEGRQFIRINNDLRALPAGMYYLRIVLEEYTRTISILKN